VARQLGPIVKYRGGAKKGQPVGPDIEAWLQKDSFQGKPGIVAQWAQSHPALATNWIKADPLNLAFVAAWQKNHPSEVAAWIEAHPASRDPKPEELAVPFFVQFAAEHPGRFPALVEHKTADGKIDKRIEPAPSGSDIQGIFFDMWLHEHPDADLESVPADMVMASASGLDPHITMKNAQYQLDRVAGKWADRLKRDPAAVRAEIEGLLREHARAPLAGLAGVDLINVFEINLALQKRWRN
jgi:K+-transporting ATPase ATPase C chain